MNNQLILSSEKVNQIIRRISYQIHENHLEEDQIVMIGVDIGGRFLADQINSFLSEISNLKVSCYTLKLDKEMPLSKDITIDGDIEELTKYPIILCDDVLNTGKTLTYSLSKLLMWDLKKVETAVLVLRSYSKFPIHANYKGYQLATTINEQVNVVPGKGIFLT